MKKAKLESELFSTQNEIVRINGKLREIVTISDNTGAILSKVVSPLMVELHAKDIFEIIVGSLLFAFPISLTEEVWILTSNLPLVNILAFSFVSMFFITVFIYFNFYKGDISKHYIEFFKRVLSTYFLTLFTASLLLVMIDKAPWGIDNLLALKRTLFVAFPASFAATIADSIK